MLIWFCCLSKTCLGGETGHDARDPRRSLRLCSPRSPAQDAGLPVRELCEANLCLQRRTAHRGQIAVGRYSFECVREVQNFPDNWVLIIHGFGEKSYINRINNIDTNDKVILSLDRLLSDRLHEMIGSAHIGLVLNKDWPCNESITAVSSEKLALYIKCGLPIIAFKYPGYEIIEEYQCCILIENIHELSQAIEKIGTNLEEYSANAYKCFTEQYEFLANFTQVIRYINDLSLLKIK